MTSKKKSQKIFPIHVYQKRGPNFTISPIPAFEGHLLQIFWRSIIEARANLANALAKILWSYGMGGGASGHPNTLQLRHWMAFSFVSGLVATNLPNYNFLWI
jgi:hypothetical protein